MKITIIFDSGKVTKLSFTSVEIFELKYTKDDKTGVDKKTTTRMYFKSENELNPAELANYIMWTIYESDNKFVQFVNTNPDSIFVLRPAKDHVVSFEIS